MSWTIASAIAGMVASVAVVAALIYLAIQTEQLRRQTEQNTIAMVSNSRQQALNAELQVLRMVVDYPVTGLTYEAAADEDGRRRQQTVDLAFFRIREQQWLQYTDGQLDEATRELVQQPCAPCFGPF